MQRLMRIALLSALLLLHGCARPDALAPPSPDRLPAFLSLPGQGPVLLWHPLAASSFSAVPDTTYLWYRVLPREKWFLTYPLPSTGWSRVVVHTIGGAVECVFAEYPSSTDYGTALEALEARLGPRDGEKSTHPIGRTSWWADRSVMWSLTGPKPGLKALLSLALTPRDTIQDPRSEEYFRACPPVPGPAR